MNTNHEKVYHSLVPGLQNCDLEAQAKHMGFPINEKGEVLASFLGDDYKITTEGVFPLTENTHDFTRRSLLIHYISSEGRGEPEYSFVPLTNLSGIPCGQQNHDNIMSKPIVDVFGNNYTEFTKAALKIGGIDQGASLSSGHAWLFPVLPKIPIQLVFFEGDEDFLADIQFLYDRSATFFMGYECIAVLSFCLGKALTNALAHCASGL